MHGADSLKSVLETAFARRRALLGETSCLRLFDGAGDGEPGLTIDLYDAVLVCHVHNPTIVTALAESCGAAIDAIRDIRTISGGFIWLHQQSGVAAQGRCVQSFGTPPQQCVVLEHGIQYELRPGLHKSAGLFTDMREVRRMLIARRLQGQVINTFCFTGALGIAAAFGGASPVIQVDVSKSALTWARGNSALNPALVQREVKYVPEDSLRYLERVASRVQRGQQPAAMVIVDPPSFGRSDHGEFRLERDLPALVKASLAVLHEKGELIVTCNTRALGCEEIESIVNEALMESGIQAQNYTQLTAPAEDFLDVSTEATSARGVWVKL